MFDLLDDKALVESALETGKIQFIVRGSLECPVPFDFSDWLGIRVSGPTYRLRVIGENQSQDSPIGVFVNELQDEVVFPGEVVLREKSVAGVGQALGALELWADFICLAVGNPKIQIEVQTPVRAGIGIKNQLEASSVDRWATLLQGYRRLDRDGRRRISGALWWYRKACAAAYYSLFDSYTAYWNCLEILCNVSGNRVKEGPEVDQAIQTYLNDKKKIGAGHVQEIYNRFVNYSIKSQMKDALKDESMLGKELADQFVYQCLEILPEKERLYQIRNDINHGNIRENSAQDRERVYLRGMLLWQVVMQLLYRRLGFRISLGIDINASAEGLANPRWRGAEP